MPIPRSHTHTCRVPWSTAGRCLLILALVVICLAVQAAPGDEEEMVARSLYQAPFNIAELMSWLFYGISYLVIYAAVLLITMSCFRLGTGLDGPMIGWVLILWVGGMLLATGAYWLTDSRPLALAMAMPLLFIFSTVLMRLYDHAWDQAAKVSVVVVLLCAAYITPPWVAPLREPKAPPRLEESSTPVGVASVCCHVVEHAILDT